MTPEDFSPFIERLTRLAGLLDSPLTSERIAGYVDALQDLQLDDLLVAMGRAGRECEFFPKPRQLRAFAVDTARIRLAAEAQARRNAEPMPEALNPEERQRAEEAFQQFVAQAREILSRRTF